MNATWINKIWSAIRQKSPEILMGIGTTSLLTTTVLAVLATPKAMQKIEEKKEELRSEKLTAAETVKAAGKCYIPAAVSAGVGVGCLIASSKVSSKRNAALAMIASVTETSLREYRDKVVETVGEKKESAIMDAVEAERVRKDPPKERELEEPLVPESGGMKVLCKDATFGRYFYSNVDTIKTAVIDLNDRMKNGCEPYISLNDFYEEVGASPTDAGDELGWNVDHEKIELHYSSTLVNGRTPCLAISHINMPRYGYNY